MSNNQEPFPEEELEEMPFKKYEIVEQALRNYVNQITPEQAFTDEMIQNFVDEAKKIIAKRRQEGNLSSKSVMEAFFDNSNPTNRKIIFTQNGTGGILNREQYKTYAFTGKLHSKTDAGSKGIGWKIWLLISDRVFTETNCDGKYYQLYQRNYHDKKLLKLKGWIKEGESLLFPKKISNENDTRIEFDNVNPDWYKKIEDNFIGIIQDRWYKALEKYPEIVIILHKSDGSSQKINPKPRFQTIEGLEPIYIDDKKISTGDILKNGWFSFTEEQISEDKRGTAIIINDRVLTWYEPREREIGRTDRKGYIIGEIEADFLHTLDNSSHDAPQKQLEEWKGTAAAVRNICAEIIDRVNGLEYTEKFPSSGPSDLINQINRILGDLNLSSAEIEQGGYAEESEKKGKKEETTESIKKDIEIIVHQPTTLGLEWGTNYDFEVQINNLSPLKKQCQFSAKAKKKTLNFNEQIDLEPNSSKLIKFQYSPPITLPRGDLPLILTITNLQNQDEFVKKILVFELEKIITNFSIKSINPNRGGSAEVNFDIERIKLSGTRKIALRIFEKTEIEPIHEEFFYISPQQTKISQKIVIPIDNRFNRCTHKIEIAVENGAQKEQVEYATFNIEKYISSIKPSKKNLRFNEQFEIELLIVNTTETETTGKLIVELDHKDHVNEIIENSEITINNGENLVRKISKAFSENYPPGNYIFNASFQIIGENDLEEKSCFVILEKPEKESSKGFLSDFDYQRNPKGKSNKNFASLGSGKVKINTFHYLFNEVEDESGINFKALKKMIIQALWYVYRDEIKKNTGFEEMWEWEEYLLNKI